MTDFYLGNGNKRPKLEDYRREFGINGQIIYILDKIKYERKQRESKRVKEVNKKSSLYASNLGWGILPAIEKEKNKK